MRCTPVATASRLAFGSGDTVVGCWNTSAAGRLVPPRCGARLRHVVINVLRLDKSVFGGISVKRKELTWDDEKLLGLMLAA